MMASYIGVKKSTTVVAGHHVALEGFCMQIGHSCMGIVKAEV